MSASTRPRTPPITLRAGPLSLGLVPDIGGSVAFFRVGSADLMRALSVSDDARGDVLGTAMFPMVPYANRIAGNRFTFGDAEWQVSPNNPPERFNVHGTGWRRPWQVDRSGFAEAWLSLEHDDPPDPYTYRAVQRFVLTPEGLIVTMTITNRGVRPMPFGFGLHPWFERDDARLMFRATRFWLEGPEGVATEPITLPVELDFGVSRRLPATWRNNAYGGWDGKAEIRFPARGLGLRIDAGPLFTHLMFYADPDKPYFCLEPQTNAPCAFNRVGHVDAATLGIITLDPGQTSEGSVSFKPLLL